MIRVLHMIGSLDCGGSQMMVINLYKAIDRSRVQFDFVIDHSDQRALAPVVESLGANIYEMPTYKGVNIGEVKRAWEQFFTQHPEYKILHVHVRSYASLFIPIAKKHGLITIVHSHSTSNGNGIKAAVKDAMQLPIRWQADYFFGCSKKAGEWLFGNKIVNGPRYHMLPNSIDMNLYQYNAIDRKKCRDELGVSETQKVYVHVGRFHPAKNHKFLLDVFAKLIKKQSNSILLLVGDGQLRPDIENQMQMLGIERNVLLLGHRDDVHYILQAADCFLFPSRWEGLPVTVVEAQAVGLPCLISDNISDDVCISDLVHKIPINHGEDIWVDAMLTFDYSRRDVSEEIKKAGFDVSATAQWLTEFYEKLANE